MTGWWLRVLAVTGTCRSLMLADVPTAADLLASDIRRWRELIRRAKALTQSRIGC